MIIDNWHNCYSSKWKGIATPESMRHPAKFSSKLIARIYDHLKTGGVITAGSFVLDPFAGVALGSLDANRIGVNWFGVEIEPENVLAGASNINLWHEVYRPKFSLWGESSLILGNSADLSAVSMGLKKKQKFDAIVSSPPFLQTTGGSGLGKKKGNEGPINSALLNRHRAGNRAVSYGVTDGQIARMRPDEFYEIASRIIENCYKVLKPAGRAVWVVKNYVERGEVIDFTGNWRELCETAGFITEHEHKAQFSRNRQIQYDIFGNEHITEKTSKSFFRRVVEKRHNLPPIDYESVLCMYK